jgi:hypothetical protein
VFQIGGGFLLCFGSALGSCVVVVVVVREVAACSPHHRVSDRRWSSFPVRFFLLLFFASGWTATNLSWGDGYVG